MGAGRRGRRLEGWRGDAADRGWSTRVGRRRPITRTSIFWSGTWDDGGIPPWPTLMPVVVWGRMSASALKSPLPISMSGCTTWRLRHRAADRRPDPADPSRRRDGHFVRGRLAAEAGDTVDAVTEMEAFGAMFEDPAISVQFPGLYVLDSAGRRSCGASRQSGRHPRHLLARTWTVTVFAQISSMAAATGPARRRRTRKPSRSRPICPVAITRGAWLLPATAICGALRRN